MGMSDAEFVDLLNKEILGHRPGEKDHRFYFEINEGAGYVIDLRPVYQDKRSHTTAIEIESQIRKSGIDDMVHHYYEQTMGCPNEGIYLKKSDSTDPDNTILSVRVKTKAAEIKQVIQMALLNRPADEVFFTEAHNALPYEYIPSYYERTRTDVLQKVICSEHPDITRRALAKEVGKRRQALEGEFNKDPVYSTYIMLLKEVERNPDMTAREFIENLHHRATDTDRPDCSTYGALEKELFSGYLPPVLLEAVSAKRGRIL